MVKAQRRPAKLQRGEAPAAVQVTAISLLSILKIVGSALVATAAAAAAYAYLGLPMFATREYVNSAIHPLVDKIEGINANGLHGRLEQLSGNRQRALAEKFDLDLKTRTIDPKAPGGTAALSVIQGRERDIEDIVKNIDDQIADTKAELKRAQDTRGKKQ